MLRIIFKLDKDVCSVIRKYLSTNDMFLLSLGFIHLKLNEIRYNKILKYCIENDYTGLIEFLYNRYQYEISTKNIELMVRHNKLNIFKCISRKQKIKESVVYTCVYENRLDMLKYMINDLKYKLLYNYLEIAIIFNYIEMFNYLTSIGNDVHIKCFVKAVLCNNFEFVKVLHRVKCQFPVDIFVIATEIEDLTIFEYLLKKKYPWYNEFNDRISYDRRDEINILLKKYNYDIL